jgi:hypothetical protein
MDSPADEAQVPDEVIPKTLLEDIEEKPAEVETEVDER